MFCSSGLQARQVCISSFLDAAHSQTYRDRADPPRPIGMKAKHYQALLDLFSGDPVFQSAEVIVLYGSRTHFDHGISPAPNSDLDIAVAYRNSSDSLSFQKDINIRLDPISEKAGFPIGQQIPLVESLEKFVRSPENLEDFDVAQSLIDQLAEVGSWDRKIHKQVAMQLADEEGRLFNSEAIFVFRRFPRPGLLEKLREAGYYNFVFLTRP